MEARQALQVVLQKGKKGSFSVNVKKQKKKQKASYYHIQRYG